MFILKEEIQTLSVQNVVEEDADKLEESTKKVSFMTSSFWTNKDWPYSSGQIIIHIIIC